MKAKTKYCTLYAYWYLFDSMKIFSLRFVLQYWKRKKKNMNKFEHNNIVSLNLQFPPVWSNPGITRTFDKFSFTDHSRKMTLRYTCE